MVRSLIGAFAVAALASCAASLAPQSFGSRQPTLRPEEFFAGVTQSTGVLQSRSGSPTHRFRVDGIGTQLADGTLRLEQSVAFEGRPPEVRVWVLQRLDEHRYTATLTDASGPVEAEAYGDLLHLGYAMKSPWGGRMEQWMYLQPDGRTVVNEATVSVLGVVVVRLSERITRSGVDRSPPSPSPSASAPIGP